LAPWGWAAAQEASAPPVSVETADYRVEFSTDRAAPVRWTLALPRGEAVEFTPPQDAGEAGPFDLLWPEGVSAPKGYQLTRATEDGTETLRFESPPTDQGLVVTKSFRFRRAGHLSNFTVSLRNDGASDVVGGDAGKGLGGKWGGKN
jgi:hypothetical protein